MKNRTRALPLLWTILLQCLQAVATGLPPTGTGSAYASRCNAAKHDWIVSRGQTFVSETTYNSTTTGLAPSTSITTTTYLSSDATPYTLCDGYARINGSRTILTITSTTPYSSVIETSSSVFRNISQPQCTIGASDCSNLQQSYTSALARYSILSQSMSSAAVEPPPSPTSPICGSATLPLFTSSVGQPACAMQEASIQLLYWPVTVADSCDPCHRGRCPTTTMGPTISGHPNTFKTLNTTLTSPTVYMEFMGSWAYTSAGTTYSSPQTLILAQEPDAVSSLCGRPGGGYGPPQKVNYANFNYPVPADVYRCQPSCFVEPMPFTYANITNTFTYSLETTTETRTNTIESYISEATSNLCSTLWNDYAPVLSIPEAFKTIRPAGFQGPDSVYGNDNPCNFIFNEQAVLFDPPLALTEQSEEARPTLPNANSAYPTPPGPDPTLTVPIQTSEPQVTALPESLGLTIPSNGPVATVYTATNPSAGLSESSESSQAIGNVIASVLGMTSEAQGQDDQGGRLTLAMASDGSAIVINGVTTSIAGGSDGSSNGNDAGETVQTGMVTVDGSTIGYTNSAGTLVIGDQTLSQGGSVVVTGKASTEHTTGRQTTASGSQPSDATATTSGSSTLGRDYMHLRTVMALLTAAFMLVV